jgi:hypothetical protein
VRWQPQQTVKLAIDCETGELVAAETLLQLDEARFSQLRREAMEARVERKRGGSTVRFQCAICKQPLFLSRYREENTNRWFVHDGKSEQCPWHEGSRLTPDQTKALVYRGQQEGARHKEYKKFLAHWLNQDPLVLGVAEEQTTFSEVMKGEWRRPDVKCHYNDISIVFEIQLSYTFLSDVIARDEFYKREGIFIIWIFADFDLNRAAVSDEAFFNRRNLFVLDADAMQATSARGSLTFSGYRQSPHLADNQIRDAWTWEFVGLSDVTFPRENFRPYFYDYDAARQALVAEQIEVRRTEEQTIWQQDVKEYLDLALRYFDSDHADDARDALISKVDELEKCGHWQQSFEALRDEEFYGWHGVLSVLLSIKLQRSVSYSSKLTVFQVIEAGLRTGYRKVSRHAYAILYLWAYKTYQPAVTAKNQKWLSEYAHKLKESIDRGETTYRRYDGFDAEIGLIFPELAERLQTRFGLPAENIAKDESSAV